MRGRISTASDRDRGSKAFVLGLIWVGMGVAFSAAGALPVAAIGGPRWLLFAVGITAMLAGTAGREWAIRTLGQFFTLEVRVADHQAVVEDGPYRFVRHPGYAASLLTFAGMGLALGNWLSLVVVVGLPLVGYYRRIQVEERTLTAELGESYSRYAATHRRLIPGIW